jgi:hypothetical protein
MKQGSLFCFARRDLSQHGASCRTLGMSGKLSMNKGAST